MSHKENTHQMEEKDILLKSYFINRRWRYFILGPGTTVEILAEEMNHHSLTIITNCLPV